MFLRTFNRIICNSFENVKYKFSFCFFFILFINLFSLNSILPSSWQAGSQTNSNHRFLSRLLFEGSVHLPLRRSPLPFDRELDFIDFENYTAIANIVQVQVQVLYLHTVKQYRKNQHSQSIYS